jgi:hypothetical protein
MQGLRKLGSSLLLFVPADSRSAVGSISLHPKLLRLPVSIWKRRKRFDPVSYVRVNRSANGLMLIHNFQPRNRKVGHRGNLDWQKQRIILI